jgi:signal peptidase I
VKITGSLHVGDYVLATKYHDGDPQDHWCVGFYHSDLDYGGGGTRYQVVDGDGNQFRGNGFRRVEKISPELGKWLLDNARQIETSGLSVWRLALAKLNIAIRALEWRQ